MPLQCLKKSLSVLLWCGNWIVSLSVICSLSSPSSPSSSLTDLLFHKEVQLVPFLGPVHSFFSVPKQLFFHVIQDPVPTSSPQRGFHDPWLVSQSQFAFCFNNDLGYLCVSAMSPSVPLRMPSLRSLLLSSLPMYGLLPELWLVQRRFSIKRWTKELIVREK